MYYKEVRVKHTSQRRQGLQRKPYQGFEPRPYGTAVSVTNHYTGWVTKGYGHELLSGVVATVAEWSRYGMVAVLVTSSSPVPLKTRRVGQRCMLNRWRAQTSSLGVVL
ncbi:hypothetical protein TNCV_2949331 [Trichonephila clavipes]|nr:hypothetical protein TNCV_2949331 [Trichonephila clavipes]